MHAVETLWDELAASDVAALSPRVTPFHPEGVGEPFAVRKRVVVPHDPKLDGMSFFPVGTGLVGTRRAQELPAPPECGVMVVAHNWGSEHDRERALDDSGGASYLPTNRSILALLETADIDPSVCFFTNAYPCLARGSSAVGPLGITAEDPFDGYSRRFLVRQYAIFHPSLLVVLGKPAARALARWFGVEPWQGGWTFQELSNAGWCIVDLDIDGARVVGVVTPHPSMPNWRYYSFSGVRGRDGVVLALADAWHQARAPAANGEEKADAD